MIVRNQPSKDFTVIRNAVLERTDLSLKAKGLWAFLMTKPDGWQTSIMGVVAQSKESKLAVMTALKELESVGLYRKIRQRDEQGKFKFEDYVYDSPYTVNPHADNRHAGNPTQVNTNIVNTEEVTINSYELIGPKAEKQPEEFGNSEVNQVIEHFEKRIGHMPRAKYQRWAASTLIKQHGFEKVIGGINAVVSSRDQQYAPSISTLEALRDKWIDLETFYQRSQTKKRGLIIA
jgi:hypothetical protein